VFREITSADSPARPLTAHKQDLGAQGQRRNTLPPSGPETSEHNPKTKQDWRPAATTTDMHIPARSACISN